MALCLSGCAIPPPVTVAKLLLDGISYVSTDKSVNDHVLSEVTHRDCAMLRVVEGKVICRDYKKGEHGLLKTVALSLEKDATADAAVTPVANTRQPIRTAGQISAAGPIVAVEEAPRE